MTYIRMNKKELESIFYNNIKEASLVYDKVLLALSSVFLWFLFSRVDLIISSEKNFINIEYLTYSIFMIIWVILFILLWYLLTMLGAVIWWKTLKYKEKSTQYKTYYVLYQLINNIIYLLIILSFLFFVTSTILISKFYISNLNNMNNIEQQVPEKIDKSFPNPKINPPKK